MGSTLMRLLTGRYLKIKFLGRGEPPTTRIAGSCARATSGQAVADPTIPLMKSRRRIAFLKA
jgi:hypothetical protein